MMATYNGVFLKIQYVYEPLYVHCTCTSVYVSIRDELSHIWHSQQQWTGTRTSGENRSYQCGGVNTLHHMMNISWARAVRSWWKLECSLNTITSSCHCRCSMLSHIYGMGYDTNHHSTDDERGLNVLGTNTVRIIGWRMDLRAFNYLCPYRNEERLTKN